MLRRPPSEVDTLSVWLGRTAGDPERYARELLAERAAHRLGTPAAAVTVVHSPHGRPRLADHDALHLSLGHTRGAVAVAVTTLGPVGVDVEAVRTLPALALARRWLTPSEADWVHAHPVGARVGAFLKLWTAKEAMGKALGTGLRGGGLYRAVPVPGPGAAAEPLPPPADGPTDRVRLLPVPGEPGLAVAHPAAPDGLVVAVACLSPAAAGGSAVVETRDGR